MWILSIVPVLQEVTHDTVDTQVDGKQSQPMTLFGTCPFSVRPAIEFSSFCQQRCSCVTERGHSASWRVWAGRDHGSLHSVPLQPRVASHWAALRVSALLCSQGWVVGQGRVGYVVDYGKF